MKRIHLFELEDLPWWPKVIRDAMTAYLTTLITRFGLMEPILPKLHEAFARSKASTVVDLCSGAGGPARVMANELERIDSNMNVVCTDLFPNQEALTALAQSCAPRMTFQEAPIDATDVPEELRGLRTIFNAFHHLKPELARKVLEDAHDKRQPIAIFEMVDRGFLNLASLPFIPLMVMGLLPILRPFRALWIPLTYLVPVIPLAILWDGMVSSFRVYRPDELRELVLDLDDFDWDIGRIKHPAAPMFATYLVGIPK